eukprot:TRINITY_DN1763_c0_g1_i2.p1 TRINITY_DN1763_c0_g1~~TRINITY_DN1763_c0_g1_i2.p1  ORF type:complete len:625 (-),score=197.67 TRINITY_DN1763_c0_g1_i2:535-2409(-)
MGERMRCAWILSKKANVFWGALMLVVGVVFITIGALIPRMVDEQIHAGVQNKVVVDGFTSDSYDSWRTSTLSTSAPYYKLYYFFNITNPLEVKAGLPPVLEEVGPYKYRYFTEKVDVVFSEGGDEVGFKLYEHFHWNDLDNPGKSRNDTVYTVNPAYVAILSKIGATAGTDKWEFILKAVYFSQYLAKLYSAMSTTMVNFVVSQVKVALGATLDTATAPWASTVSAEIVTNVKNPNSLYSFANSVGSSLWTRAIANDQSAVDFLSAAWLTPKENIVNIATWLNQQLQARLQLALLAQFKANQTDLPFVQWNTMEVLKGRLKDLVDQLSAASPSSSAPVVPPFAEFQAYSLLAERNAPSPFTTQLVKEFFLGNGRHQGFQQPLTVATFLQLMMLNNTATISAMFGWDASQTAFFMRYFNFVFANSLDAVILRGNGGLFATNKVDELLFKYNDPLTAVLAPERNPIKVTLNNTSVEDAQTRLPTTMNTGEKDISKINNYISWKNSTVVNGWVTPEPVAAGDGTCIPPASDPISELQMFSQTLQRRIYITYQGNVNVKGISLYEYQLKENSFDSSKKNPDNARYFANIDGFHNMTSMELIAGNPESPSSSPDLISGRSTRLTPISSA